MENHESGSFIISHKHLDLPQAWQALDQKLEMSALPEFTNLIRENRKFLDSLLETGADLYGTTTGFGNSSNHKISTQKTFELQKNLTRYHGCGVGPYLSEEICKAVLLVRINCLAKGKSAVSSELLTQLVNLWNHEIIPAIPCRGSVGASGDLTPLIYIAAVLQGERECYYKGQISDTTSVFQAQNLTPYALKPKEALAIMNGTSVMTAMTLLGLQKCNRILDLVQTLTALLIELLEGRVTPFIKELHDLKPHKGQGSVAEKIYSLLKDPTSRLHRDTTSQNQRIQDSYSIRCSPHVLGVLADIIDYTSKWTETELNSSNDNPLFDHENELVLNGGHFFGGHIAAACDHLKVAVANSIGLLDKQLSILIDSRLNGQKFRDNLVDINHLGMDATLHHGCKAMQITLSSLAAEMFSMTGPVSVHSRTTECLNQDVVSLGTISARQLLDILSLAEEAISVYTICLLQAVYLKSQKTSTKYWLSPALDLFVKSVFTTFKPIIADRPLHQDIKDIQYFLFKIKKS